jgi:hypothetical protein
VTVPLSSIHQIHTPHPKLTKITTNLLLFFQNQLKIQQVKKPINPLQSTSKTNQKSNQITKPRSSSTLSRDRSFNRGERVGENGRKEKKKKGKREQEVMKMEKKKKKKTLKNGWLRFFYSMKSYSSFSFVKSYCSTLAI